MDEATAMVEADLDIKKEVPMVYVGRTDKGEIFGVSTVKQEWATEELPDNHPDVVAFCGRKPVERTTEQKLAAIGLTLDELKKALQ